MAMFLDLSEESTHISPQHKVCLHGTAIEFNQFSKRIMRVSIIVPSHKLFTSIKHDKKTRISIKHHLYKNK
jgi:hypothetical protein